MQCCAIVATTFDGTAIRASALSTQKRSATIKGDQAVFVDYLGVIIVHLHCCSFSAVGTNGPLEIHVAKAEAAYVDPTRIHTQRSQNPTNSPLNTSRGTGG